MGLTLYQRPNGLVSDLPLDNVQLVCGPKECPLLDDAQPVYEPKERNPPLVDAQLVDASNECNCPLDDSQLVCKPKERNPPLDDPQPVDEPEERDPHVIPTFTSESLTKPSSTILYLPPLLSSLPHDVSAHPVSIDRPPLVTETRLPDIDPVSLSLHKALHHFRPLSEDYAGLPYADAFNWPELDLPEDEEREWYAVVFRSRRKKGSDSGRK